MLKQITKSAKGVFWRNRAQNFWHYFIHWQLIHKWTFVKPITPTCHWWICIFCFAFNLNSIWVMQKLKRRYWRYLLCNGQNLVFWGGGNLPLHFRFWSLCVKWLSNNNIYFSERGPSDTFVPNFEIFMIHLSGKGWTRKSPFAKGYHFIPILFINVIKNYKVYPKM